MTPFFSASPSPQRSNVSVCGKESKMTNEPKQRDTKGREEGRKEEGRRNEVCGQKRRRQSISRLHRSRKRRGGEKKSNVGNGLIMRRNPPSHTTKTVFSKVLCRYRRRNFFICTLARLRLRFSVALTLPARPPPFLRARTKPPSLLPPSYPQAENQPCLLRALNQREAPFACQRQRAKEVKENKGDSTGVSKKTTKLE